MKDRVVQHANRYKLTPVSGDIYDLTPEPGIVTEQGTSLNKASLLTDAVAALLGLSGDPTVAAALSALNARAKIAVGTYVGTGTYGSANPNSLTLNFDPKLLFVTGGVGFAMLCVFGGAYTNAVFNASTVIYRNTVSWDGNTVSWYQSADITPATKIADAQKNTSAVTYNYVSIG